MDRLSQITSMQLDLVHFNLLVQEAAFYEQMHIGKEANILKHAHGVQLDQTVRFL